MQKLILTFFLSVFTVLFGNAVNIHTKSNEFFVGQTKDNINPVFLKDDCSVTASSTSSGQDCFGNPISVTATCSSSASTCSQAYTQAGACAYGKAVMGVADIMDCP